MTQAIPDHPARAACLPAQCAGRAGFTLVELVMVIVITGILGAFIAPRFMQNPELAARGFSAQVTATLRYAQKSAVAQHRYVCVAFTISSVTLSINSTPSCPGAALPSADGNAVTQLTAPRNVFFTALPADFHFDPLGRVLPAVVQRLQVAGAPATILVEAETGYVH